jgi:SAM-dependent methyltransferase
MSEALHTQKPLSQQLQALWEQNWQRPNYTPTWLVNQIPAALTDSVASRWFPSGATLLDIGCGSGEIAAWLAAQGFRVIGVDFSPTAIDRARVTYPAEPDLLTFQVTDICRDAPPAPCCNALFDRGCLHGLPKALYPDYVRTVAAWALPQARFLLLCGVNQGEPVDDRHADQLRREMMMTLEAVFLPSFAITKWEPILIDRNAHRTPVPGVAVWMIRQPPASTGP